MNNKKVVYGEVYGMQKMKKFLIMKKRYNHLNKKLKICKMSFKQKHNN